MSVEENLDTIFGENSTSQHRASQFHYVPRTNQNPRFELGIATKSMLDASWRLCHGRLVLMDGTFGVCVQKILLFVLIALDENGKGIPVAILHFSAPQGNKFTASGYNSQILEKLLRSWRVRVEEYGQRQGNASPFKPRVTFIIEEQKRGALGNIP